MSGFTDMHSHFVYGVDDGARTREEMFSMLDAAYENGIATLVSTPHVTPGVEAFDTERYLRHLSEAKQYCAQRNYEMELYSGAELLYTPMMLQHVAEKNLPTIGASNAILVEFTPDINLRDITDLLAATDRANYRVTLAHIERYACLSRGRTAQSIKQDYNVEYQVNANTVIENQGFLRNRLIHKWLENRAINYIASDAHNCSSRPFRMKEAYEKLIESYDEQYVLLLTGYM